MTKERFDLISGYLAAAGQVLTTCFSAASVQALQGAVPDFQLSAARGFMQGISYLLLAKITRVSTSVTKKQFSYLLVLSSLYMFYNIGEYGATGYIPLIETIGIATIAALFSAALQAQFLLKVELKKIYIIVFPVLIVGIVMVTQPFQSSGDMCCLFQNQSLNGLHYKNASSMSGVLTSIACNNTNNEPLPGDTQKKVKGYILATVGGLAGGLVPDLYAVLISDLQPVITAMYSASLCFVASTLMSFYFEPPVVLGSMWQYFLVLVHCIASVLNTYSALYSSHKIGGVRFVLACTPQVILYLVVQYTLMKEIMPGHRNWMEVLGAIILVIGATIAPAFDMIQLKREINILP